MKFKTIFLMIALLSVLILLGCTTTEDTPEYTESNYTEADILELMSAPTINNCIETDVYVLELGAEPAISNAIAFSADRPYGDVNNDHRINISDLTDLITLIVNHVEGDKPPKRCDINGDCGVNLDDAYYLVLWMFQGGPAPIKPCSL